MQTISFVFVNNNLLKFVYLLRARFRIIKKCTLTVKLFLVISVSCQTTKIQIELYILSLTGLNVINNIKYAANLCFIWDYRLSRNKTKILMIYVMRDDTFFCNPL